MAQFSRTWWGQRFIEALEQFTDPGRLGRGRSYAHNGRILDYTITNGTVKARVAVQSTPTLASTKNPFTGPPSPSKRSLLRIGRGLSPDCITGGPGDETAAERDARHD